MDWSLKDFMLSIATLIGTLITATITYKTFIANSKSQERKDDLENEKFHAAEKLDSVERLGDISLKLVSSLESQLKDCTNQRAMKEKDLVKITNNLLEIRMLLQDAITFHNKNKLSGCEYSKQLDNILADILARVEKDL